MKYAFKTAILSAAVAIAGFSMPAAAAPAFTVDTSLFGYNTSPFVASFISGTASTLVRLDQNQVNQYGTGYVKFNTFEGVGAFDSGLNLGNSAGYSLWAEFSYTLTLASGAYAAPGSSYTVSALSFALYGEKQNGVGNNSVFTAASNTNTASGTVVHSTDTKTLGTGLLESGVSSLNQGLGTSLNSTLDFALTADGKAFFVAPVPFYDMAFTSFTNVSSGFLVNGPLGVASINDANGGVTFNNKVPEPSSIALLGLGLVGLAAVRRRKNTK